MSDQVIGRGATSSPKATPKPSSPALPGLTDKINKAAGNVNLKLKTNATTSVDFVTGLTAAQVKQITPWLKKFGATKTEISTVQNAKKTLQSKFSVYVDNAGGSLEKLLKSFADDYIPTADASAASGPKSNGVTQYVTKKNPQLITNMINDTLTKTIGTRAVTPEIRKELNAIVQKMIDAGTTTVSKMDKNGKTTVTQTAGYSDEAASAAVAERAKVLAPKDYERQQGLSFFDWMQNAESMRGGR